MDEGHTVFVSRHGFLSSLVLGICGMISVTVICATAVGLYGLYIVDDKIEEFVGASPDMIEALTDWQEALPPALADAMDDRRDVDYRPMVDASVELLGADSRSTTPVIEVVNQGDKVITLLSMRVTVEDDEGIPGKEMTVYAATPITIEDEWRGPLLPGSTRRFALRSGRLGRDAALASLEITELRVWNGEGTPDEFDVEDAGEIQLPERDSDDESNDNESNADEQENDSAEDTTNTNESEVIVEQEPTESE
jgi:hypothetical protein